MGAGRDALAARRPPMGPGRDSLMGTGRYALGVRRPPSGPLVPAIPALAIPTLAPQPQAPSATAGLVGAPPTPGAPSCRWAIDPHQLERRQPVDKVSHKQM
jgi:hypothetical protein